ncbi:MAG TPA: phenylalanine--tRNA ligase subunit alpha, partial [Spirochaetota bacterium]|nr:phenylalanine--tRNA ligase subunit alpha [Spirochaetota bacterium]
MEQQLTTLRAEALSAISGAGTVDAVEELRVKYLGRKGALTLILRSLGTLQPDQRAAMGKLSNEFKVEIEAALDSKKVELASSGVKNLASTQWIDVTLDTPTATDRERLGRLHPISQIQYEIEDIFTSMGFEIHNGPEAETDYYNFEALNIPKHHPARDMQDTFWTEDGNLLRTHTSAIQIRAME